MSLLTVNNLTYHYAVREPLVATTATPLVLLHGFTGSGANWQDVAARFAHTCPVITIDLLGHGQSAAPDDARRYHMAESARDLVDLLARLAPGPVNLLGYSMGGRLALYLAVTYPQLFNKLILESASPGLADVADRAARVRSDEALAARIAQEGIAAFVDYWENIPLFASQQRLPAATRERLRNQRLQNRAHGLANSLRGMGTGAQPALWEQLSTLTMPVLLLTGELDTKFCAIATQMATLLPHAHHQTIAGAGHTIHLEAPAAYVAALTEFLSGE